MSVVLDELATQVKGLVNIAKIDASLQRSTSFPLDVRSYPTLLYRQEGSYHRYLGGTTLQQLRAFAERLSGVSVVWASRMSEVRAVIELEGQAFVIRAQGLNHTAHMEVSASLLSSATFICLASTTDDEINQMFRPGPFVARVLKGRPPFYMTTGPMGPSAASLREFVESSSFPFVLPMDHYTYHRMGHMGKLVCGLMVNDVASAMDDLAVETFTAAAHAIPDTVLDKYVFGLLSAGLWTKHMSGYGIHRPLPKLLVVDVQADMYSHNSNLDLHNATAIMEMLIAIHEGRVALEKRSWPKPLAILKDLRDSLMQRSDILAYVLALLLVLVLLYWHSDHEPPPAALYQPTVAYAPHSYSIHETEDKPKED